MKKIVAVAAAEVADKLLVFPAAFLLGAFPPAIAALRPRRIPADVRDASALFLALLVSSTLAAVLGLRSTAGDLTSGREAFYLARPLTAFELWLGKLGGSLLVVFGAGAIALLPLVLADGPFRPSAVLPAFRTIGAATPAAAGAGGLAFAAAVALAILFLAAQAIGVAAAARSPLAAVDVALAAAALFAASRIAHGLRHAGAFAALALALAAIAAILVAGLAVGCYRAVKAGTDLREAARAQSRVFWSAAAAALLAFALLGVWVVRARPADLRRVDWVVPAARGEWIALAGPARAHEPVFLENVRTGAFVRAAFSRGTVPVISADGSTAAWSTIERGFPDSTFTPHTISLSDPRHGGVAWETKDLHESPLLVLSPDARRLAVISSDRVVVWDAARGGMLAAAKPPFPLWKEARGFTGATFAGDDRLRIFAVRPAPGGGTSIDILELDVAARRFRSSGSAGPFRRTFPILASPDRSRLLVRDAGAAVHLLDAATGRTIAIFSGGGAAFRSAAFLADGRIALFESGNGAGRLRTLSADGQEAGTCAVPGAERAWILGEPRSGALMLAGFPRGSGIRGARVLLVELGEGKVERWADGLLPAAPFAAALSGDPGAGPAPGSLSTRLFLTLDGSLVELVGPNRLRRVHPAR